MMLRESTLANRLTMETAQSDTTTHPVARRDGKPSRSKALANTMPRGVTMVVPLFPIRTNAITTAADDTRDAPHRTVPPYGVTMPRDDTRASLSVQATPPVITIVRAAIKGNRSNPEKTD